MINEILQFIKKTILAIKLARYDILCLFSGLRSFRMPLLVARWFTVRDSSPVNERIHRFLEEENNLYLSAVVEEVSAREDFVGTEFLWTGKSREKTLEDNVLYKVSEETKNKSFWQNLFKEIIIKDFPQLKEQYNGFEHRLDVQSDMRLFAAGLEELKEAAAALEISADYEIDWIRSDKNRLYLQFNQPYCLTSRLSLAEQKNLSRLFGGMLFERRRFISFWREVAVNHLSEVFFTDFDFIYTADENLCRFARHYVQGRRRPNSLMEYRLAGALKLLQYYCPDINIFEDWDKFSGKTIAFQINNNSEGLLNHLKKSGVIIDTYSEIKHTTYDDVSYLLDPKQHKSQKFSGKNSILYWGPLIIAAGFLLWYF